MNQSLSDLRYPFWLRLLDRVIVKLDKVRSNLILQQEKKLLRQKYGVSRKEATDVLSYAVEKYQQTGVADDLDICYLELKQITELLKN